jgi:hypothetical protein
LFCVRKIILARGENILSIAPPPENLMAIPQVYLWVTIEKLSGYFVGSFL